ncbi:MAG: hypothetical protein PHU61_00070 [Candidatus Absconditabacteria bacterium]|nr:hypothetical protein [Candidatus Absconditabacteria bacterium]MDD3868712.1 hypothetical protein [Candidatus Absconditabacteria bacterium]MDD4714197.1 hypothetical protein [Candidatus Absconditabacteria bacterium]
MQHYIELLQGYYKFLCLGKYFEHTAKQKKAEKIETSLRIPTSTKTSFGINTEITNTLFQEIHKHPEQKNVFGYLLEISAFRGIFSVMRELIEQMPSFRTHLQTILQEQYFPFEQTIRFLRNVLSHSSNTSLLIQEEDFKKQEEFLHSQKTQKITLSFTYSKYLKERKGSPDYSCEIKIDFSTLKANVSLRKIVPLHQMYLLAELCYNLSKVILQRMKLAQSANQKSSPKTSTTSSSTPPSSRQKRKKNKKPVAAPSASSSPTSSTSPTSARKPRKKSPPLAKIN